MQTNMKRRNFFAALIGTGAGAAGAAVPVTAPVKPPDLVTVTDEAMVQLDAGLTLAATGFVSSDPPWQYDFDRRCVRMSVRDLHFLIREHTARQGREGMLREFNIRAAEVDPRTRDWDYFPGKVFNPQG